MRFYGRWAWPQSRLSPHRSPTTPGSTMRGAGSQSHLTSGSGEAVAETHHQEVQDSGQPARRWNQADRSNPSLQASGRHQCLPDCSGTSISPAASIHPPRSFARLRRRQIQVRKVLFVEVLPGDDLSPAVPVPLYPLGTPGAESTFAVEDQDGKLTRLHNLEHILCCPDRLACRAAAFDPMGRGALRSTPHVPHSRLAWEQAARRAASPYPSTHGQRPP